METEKGGMGHRRTPFMTGRLEGGKTIKESGEHSVEW